MTERIEREDGDDHEVEIEPRFNASDACKVYRASCSCGFLGPWRLLRRKSRADRDAHLDRRAEGKA